MKLAEQHQPARGGLEAERRNIADSIVRRVLQATSQTSSAVPELLERIRFQEASIYNARAYIIAEYTSPGGFTLGRCRDHLHFLYLTHPLRRSDDELLDMAVVDTDMRLAKPHLRDIYLPGLADYSPQELLRPINNTDGFRASFLHPAILEHSPAQPEPSYPSWHRWLCEFLGIRDQIRLVARDGASLGDSFIHVATKRKEKVLGVLAQIWRRQGAGIMRNESLKELVQRITVPCTSGRLNPLWETYLPVPALEDYSEDFLDDEEHFPFLHLELGTPQEMAARWSFLHSDLGVSAKHDTGFLLDLLSCIKDANPLGLPLGRCREMARLYHDIEAKCAESQDVAAVREIVWTFISDIHGVAVPSFPGGRARWASPADCLWDAPLQMVTRVPLQAIYEDVLKCPAGAMPALSTFFIKTLSISNMDWADLTHELASLRDNGSQNEAHINMVYERIKSLSTSDQTGELRYSALPRQGTLLRGPQLTGT